MILLSNNVRSFFQIKRFTSLLNALLHLPFARSSPSFFHSPYIFLLRITKNKIVTKRALILFDFYPSLFAQPYISIMVLQLPIWACGPSDFLNQTPKFGCQLSWPVLYGCKLGWCNRITIVFNANKAEKKQHNPNQNYGLYDMCFTNCTGCLSNIIFYKFRIMNKNTTEEKGKEYSSLVFCTWSNTC